MGLSDLITQLPELIGQAVEANQWLGYTAIFAAMFLENLFPPIPSELIMPLGGFYVQQGQLDLVPVVLAGLLGTVLGALPWYGVRSFDQRGTDRSLVATSRSLDRHQCR